MFICRTCLAADNLSSIFKFFNSTQITSATGITIQENDGLPQMICQPCNDLLKGSLKLREQSIYAERILLEELNSCLKKENLHGNSRTDSEKGNFRHTNGSKTTRINKEQVEKKSYVSEGDKFSTKRNECKSKTAKGISKHESSFFMTNKDRSLKIGIKIDHIASADTSEELLKEISRKPNLQESSSTKLEQEQMYKIIDQELERSKTKHNSSIILKEELKNDFLTPDLKSLLLKNSEKTPEKTMKLLQRVPNKTKLAKLWSLAVKPVDRNKLVQCSVCPKLFKYNYFLRHAATHLEKEYTCEVCGSEFVNVYAMRYHQQRKHGADRKHACAQCDYTAVHREELTNHENRVHTGVRPFICDVCGDGFCQRRTLVQHMRRHYGVKRHKCEFCNKLFKSLSQLGAHRTQSHLLRYYFLCYECPYRSTVRDTVRRHLLKVHAIPRHEQQRIKVLKEKR